MPLDARRLTQPIGSDGAGRALSGRPHTRVCEKNGQSGRRVFEFTAKHLLDQVRQRNQLDLDLLGYIEDRPGIPPPPRHILDLERLIRESGIRFIIKAQSVPSHAPEAMADRMSIRAIALPATVTGKDGIDSYRDLFDHILSTLAPVMK